MTAYSLVRAEKRLPSSNIEVTLQGFWANVLNVEARSIGLDDSFFRLRGTSIEAMRLSSTARMGSIDLTVAAIFR